MIPTLHLALLRTRVREPRRHVDVRARCSHIVEIYDWRDEIEDDATPPHGIDKVDVDGWLRSEIA